MTDEIPKVVPNIEGLLQQCGVKDAGTDFEGVYSDIVESGRYPEQAAAIETSIRDYFGRLRLPETPTIYDYLVLSLGQNDLIATFNWDPLVYEARKRCNIEGAMPRLAFLHGCTAVGVCCEDRELDELGKFCTQCRRPLSPMKLIYPVRLKNYSSDPAIWAQWDKVTRDLKVAYFLTIFGYRAPSSDADATSLMKEAWAGNRVSNLAELNLIYRSKESADEHLTNWRAFITGSHYSTHGDFRSSWLFNYPRRTCVALWQQKMEIDFDMNPSPFPTCPTVAHLKEYVSPLIREEEDVNFRAKRWKADFGSTSRDSVRRVAALSSAMRKDFLVEPTNPRLPSYTHLLIRSVENDTYPEPNGEDHTGISSWFKVDLLGFYAAGIEVWLGGETVATDSDGRWRVSSGVTSISPNEKAEEVHVIGRIPFSGIEDYNLRGDEWRGEPQVTCWFDRDRSPYEELVYARTVRNDESGVVVDGVLDETKHQEKR